MSQAPFGVCVVAAAATFLAACSGDGGRSRHAAPATGGSSGTEASIGIDRQVRRADGRTVTYRLVGADTGPLIVYLHGSPSSRLDVDYLAERSRRRGVRVVGIDRPGYGGSSFARFDAASIADDVIAVADSLGAKQFAVIGQSSGSTYAWATAALHPDRVTAVATGGGAVPFEPGTSRWSQLGEEEQKGMSLVGEDDVEAERLLAKADLPAMEMLKLSDAELELAWKAQVVSADKRTMANGFGALLVRTMRESLRQGQIGWARDNVVRMGPWRFDHGAIKCPATQWYGEQEQQAVENAAWVTARLPSVITRIVPDRGHFVIFDDWDQLMDSLLR